MTTEEILAILEQLEVAIFASVDKDGKPHARPIHIGVANKHGVFFMTSPKTHFYQQLQENQNVAIAAYSQDNYLVQVIRIEGKVREVGRERLEEMLAGNPFVKDVYPDEQERAAVQVFQLYDGDGFYQSLTQGHKYTFRIEA